MTTPLISIILPTFGALDVLRHDSPGARWLWWTLPRARDATKASHKVSASLAERTRRGDPPANGRSARSSDAASLAAWSSSQQRGRDEVRQHAHSVRAGGLAEVLQADGRARRASAPGRRLTAAMCRDELDRAAARACRRRSVRSSAPFDDDDERLRGRREAVAAGDGHRRADRERDTSATATAAARSSGPPRQEAPGAV